MVDEPALTLRLQATLARFEAQIDKAQRKLRVASRDMEGRAAQLDRKLSATGSRFGSALLAQINPIRGALAGLVGVAGLRSLLRNTEAVAKSLDDIGKIADRIGITTDALQQLRAVGADAGVEIGGLDRAIETLSRRLAEARDGTGEAKDTLSELGIPLVDVEGKARGVVDVMGDAADAIARIEEPTRRTQIAFDLFGRSGTGLIVMLREGREKLHEYMQAASDTGQVIDESLVRGSEETITELGRLDRQIDANVARLTEGLQPALISVKGLYRDLVGVLADVAAGFDTATLAAEANRLEMERRTSGGQTGAIRTEGGTILGSANTMALDPNDPRRGVGGFAVSPRAAPVVLAPIEVRPDAPAPASVRRRGGGRGGDGQSGGARVDTSAVGMLETIRERLEALQQEYRLTGLSEQASVRLSAQFARERIERELLEAAGREGATITDAQIAQAREMAAGIEEVTLRIEERRAALEAEAEASARAERQHANLTAQVDRLSAEGLGALSGLLDGTMKWQDALSRVLLTLIEIGRQEIMDVSGGGAGGLFSALLKGLGGAIGGAGSANGGFGGGAIGPGTGGLYARGGVFDRGGVTPFARGGVVDRPTVFPFATGIGLMGEAGPEAILPLRRGPGGRLGVEAGGGGGSYVGPTIIIQGDASAQTVALIQSELRKSEARMAAAVPGLAANASRRGGAVAAQIRGG